MYTRALGLFVAFLVLLAAPVANAGAGVVEYYNELQKIKHLGLNYPLEHSQGIWVTTNQAWNTAIPASVDMGNGYIYFSDEGTGGGNYDTQIRLYRKSDQTPLVAIIENGYNPPYPEDIKVRFFTRIDGRWQDDTAWVWPKIAVDDFLTGKMTISDLRALKAIGSQVYVRLLPQSTALTAYLVVNEDIAQAVCRGDKGIRVADKSPYLRYCKHLKGRVFNKIDMVWNTRVERFRIGGKSRVLSFWGAGANAPKADAGFLLKLRALNDVEARNALITALEKKPSERVRKTLEVIATDTTEDSGVRMQAICALNGSATYESAPVLMRIIERDLKERHGYWACAIPLLGRLKDRRAIPLLLRIANLNEDHLAGMDHMAIEALANLGDEREVPVLSSKAYIVPVRLAVIEGLARIASVRSSGTLIEALQGAEEPELVKAARKGLLKIGKAAVPALKKALLDNRDQKSRSRIQDLIRQIQK